MLFQQMALHKNKLKTNLFIGLESCNWSGWDKFPHIFTQQQSWKWLTIVWKASGG